MSLNLCVNKAIRAAAGLFLLLVAAQTAQADGLSDLKLALAKLAGHSTLKATVIAKIWNKSGDGKEAKEEQGQAQVQLIESSQGMQISYGKDLLDKIEGEEKTKDKRARGVTAALSELQSTKLRSLTHAAPALLRELDKLTFTSEKAEAWNGKPARLLSFAADLDKLDESDRKYVKKVDGGLDVWINEAGIPLASRKRFNASGRAFVVVSFEAKQDDDEVYVVTGDRLVIIRKEEKNVGSGMGERSDRHSVKTLQIQS